MATQMVRSSRKLKGKTFEEIGKVNFKEIGKNIKNKEKNSEKEGKKQT